MSRLDRGLDPRAWLAWGVAASLPALLGRNPFPLAATLIAVAGVRMAWAHEGRGFGAWGTLLRVALVFAAVGTLFNVLTVRAGDRVIGRLPGWLPLVGNGELTLNALVYGVLSGLALLTLVLVGSTVGALLDWSGVVRLLPSAVAPLAVAGSVAFAFIPQTVIAWGEIREAQAARGHRIRGARDLLPVLVPLVANGLDRAVTLSEALEARGFGGAPTRVGTERGWARMATAAGLAAAATAAYLIAVGREREGVVALALAVASVGAVLLAARESAVRRTRYRPPVWRRRDSLVVAASALVALVVLAANRGATGTVRYEPYPALVVPAVSLPLVGALLLLLLPAAFAPPPDRGAGS